MCELRNKARNNSRMTYLNVSLSNLRGYPHPSICHMITSAEVQQSRAHMKMLTGDFYTYEMKAEQTGSSAHCRCCYKNSESLLHILTQCSAYQDIRERILNEIYNICTQISNFDVQSIFDDNQLLTQLILDPSSLNLKSRINTNDPLLPQLFVKSRNLCHSIYKRRLLILKDRES